MRLLIARHGATQNNLDARFTGQLDVPLSPIGERQALALADGLAGVHLDALVSSDLCRALATAEPIARLQDLQVLRDPDLREISVGSWSDRTWDAIRLEEPELVARYAADSVNVAPPGGESVVQLRARAVRALGRWCAAYPEGDVLWVTHGGFLAVLLCHVLGMDLARRWQFRRDNAAITELAVADGEITVVRLNDTHHLASLAAGDEAEASQVL